MSTIKFLELNMLISGACIAVQIPRSLHWCMCAGQLTWSGPNENHQVRVANQRCQGTYEMDSVNFRRPDDGCQIFLMHLSSLLQRCIGVILIRIHFCIIVLIHSSRNYFLSNFSICYTLHPSCNLDFFVIPAEVYYLYIPQQPHFHFIVLWPVQCI
jgi:hypothetical protein